MCCTHQKQILRIQWDNIGVLKLFSGEWRERFGARGSIFPIYVLFTGEPGKELRLDFPNHLIGNVETLGTIDGQFGVADGSGWCVLHQIVSARSHPHHPTWRSGTEFHQLDGDTHGAKVTGSRSPRNLSFCIRRRHDGHVGHIWLAFQIGYILDHRVM